MPWTGPGPGGCGVYYPSKLLRICTVKQANKTNFVAELTGSGAVSALDLAHTVAATVGAPLIDLAAVDPLRCPRICWIQKFARPTAYWHWPSAVTARIAMTADPSLQEAAEKIKFTTQLGVDWVIAEYDKLSKLIDASTSTSESMDALTSGGGGDFEFGDRGRKKPLKPMKPRPRAT